MSNIVSITEFRNNIAEVVNRVRYRNETIYLVRGKTLVAKVTRVDDYLPARVKSKNQRKVTTGVLPAVFAVLGREARGFGGIWGNLSKKFMKNASLGFKQGSIKFRRWVKFCFSFQKSWG